MLNDMNRRTFFNRVGSGCLGAALASLLSRDLYGAEPPSAKRHAVPTLLPKQPHGPAKATSVIHLFMNGGPSQMDLFDPKPKLAELHGKSYFDQIAGEVENPDPLQDFRHADAPFDVCDRL